MQRFLQRSPDKPRLTVEQGRAQRRVGELSRIYREQYPQGLPHNAIGVKYARYMCRTLAFLPRDDRAKWLDRNAAWLDGDTRYQILSFGPYWYNDRSLGNHLELYDEDRERLHVRTIEACDVTVDERKRINREKNRQRLEKRRRQNGAEPREQYEAESLSHTQPWKVDGISRRTWERRRKDAVASPTVSSLSLGQTVALASSTTAPLEGIGHGIGAPSTTATAERRVCHLNNTTKATVQPATVPAAEPMRKAA
jgi:hypothetical protein